MLFINELWLKIKEYMFHNIKKQGKHLKDDKYIINYNSVMYSIPTPIVSSTGPRIIYTSSKKQTRFIKLIYHIKYNNINKMIIEYMVLPDNYTKYYNIYDNVFRNFYYYQYIYN